MAKKGGGSEGGAALAPLPAVSVEELPRAIVRRVVKDKLTELSSGGGGGREEEVNVHKDVLLAFVESARIFIHYLYATANDICKESKRQIINAKDVLKALEEIEFPEFIEPLRIPLEGQYALLGPFHTLKVKNLKFKHPIIDILTLNIFLETKGLANTCLENYMAIHNVPVLIKCRKSSERPMFLFC